jgi:hypothetical protein
VTLSALSRPSSALGALTLTGSAERVIGNGARSGPPPDYGRPMKHRVTSGLAALGAVLAVGAALSPSPAPAAGHCVGAEKAVVHASGDDDDPPSFGPAFYGRLLALGVSLDGAAAAELPIAIEEVCNVSRRLREQAAQLAGGQGVALLLARTTVWRGHARVPAKRMATALDGADKAWVWVRLRQRRTWRDDRDGNPVPSFWTERIQITE